jgi:hypothetical protein
MIFLHEGGVPGMAKDLKNMLSKDFSTRLNTELYHSNLTKQVKPEMKTDLFAQINIPASKSVSQVPNVEQQPLISLYDLFGITEKERAQAQTKKKSKRTNLTARPALPNLFSQPQTATTPINTPQSENEPAPEHYSKLKKRYFNALLLYRMGDTYRAFGNDAILTARILGRSSFPHRELDASLPLLVKAGHRVALADALEMPKIETGQTNQHPSELFSPVERTKPDKPVQNSRPVYPVFDAGKEEHQEQLRKLQEPRPYSGVLEEYHRQGSLVLEKNGQIGYLQERYREDAIFKSLELNTAQKTKAELYIKIRDTYHQLYSYEAAKLQENAELRKSFNELYDHFTRLYGHLNEKKNFDLIKMDAGGTEMLSLERFVSSSGISHPLGELEGTGAFQKADIFNQPVAFNPNETTQADTAIEALSASLNK